MRPKGYFDPSKGFYLPAGYYKLISDDDGGGGGGGGGGGEYGLTEATPNTTYDNSSWNRNFGWGFTVGASDLTLTGVRLNAAGAVTGTARVFRKSDGVEIAEAAIEVGAGEANSWVEVALDSGVTLSAGAEYVVAIRAAGLLNRRDDPSINATFNDAITLLGTDTWFNTANTMPTSVWGNVLMGLVDIVFTVP